MKEPQRFLITYDLRAGTEEDYEDLVSALGRIGAVRLQLSVWCFSDADGTETCSTLRDYLWQYMKRRDRIMVVLFNDWSAKNGLAKVSES